MIERCEKLHTYTLTCDHQQRGFFEHKIKLVRRRQRKRCENMELLSTVEKKFKIKYVAVPNA